MTDHNGWEFDLRHAVINHLSDEEIARVIEPPAARLADGEEFLDMEHLASGVQQACGTSLRSGPLLAKSSMHPSTWQRILSMLAREYGASGTTPRS